MMTDADAEEYAYAAVFKLPEKYKLKLQKPPKEKTVSGFMNMWEDDDAVY